MKKELFNVFIVCGYKQGIGYRCFRRNFVSEVYLNNLNNKSKYFFVKIKCLASQRVSSKQYNVCALLKKD